MVAEANLIMDENHTVRKARPKSAGKGGKNTQKSYAGQKRTRPNKKDGLNKKKVLKNLLHAAVLFFLGGSMVPRFQDRPSRTKNRVRIWDLKNRPQAQDRLG